MKKSYLKPIIELHHSSVCHHLMAISDELHTSRNASGGPSEDKGFPGNIGRNTEGEGDSSYGNGQVPGSPSNRSNTWSGDWEDSDYSTW